MTPNSCSVGTFFLKKSRIEPDAQCAEFHFSYNISHVILWSNNRIHRQSIVRHQVHFFRFSNTFRIDFDFILILCFCLLQWNSEIMFSFYLCDVSRHFTQIHSSFNLATLIIFRLKKNEIETAEKKVQWLPHLCEYYFLIRKICKPMLNCCLFFFVPFCIWPYRWRMVSLSVQFCFQSKMESSRKFQLHWDCVLNRFQLFTSYLCFGFRIARSA